MSTNFEFSPADFEWVQAEARRRIGIHLSSEKKDLVINRLAPLMRRKGLSDFSQFRARLQGGSTADDEAFVSALTTNVTSLYREPQHFEFMEDRMLREPHRSSPVRVWSAACSSGEEPASILSVAHAVRAPVELWATDIDSEILAKARRLVFRTQERWPRAAWKAAFQKGTGPNEGWMRVRPDVAKAARFQRLNLSESWPDADPYDAIFCRNVLIYFDPASQARLVDRLVERLRVGGCLFLGHSESRLGNHPRLRSEGGTIFRRI
jgi:chemotaxis protein methyltransferase CheR